MGYSEYDNNSRSNVIYKNSLDTFKSRAATGYFGEYHLAEHKFFENLDKDLFEIQDYTILSGYSNLVFEGSQGIMLDKDHGIFPNVTYANTTSKNAFDIISKLNNLNLEDLNGYTIFKDDIEIYYITRCYQTRHGNGYMSSEGNISLINNQEEINVKNQYQGEFRVGELDYNILKYALEIDNIYSNNISKNLIMTCLDQRPEFIPDYSKLADNKIYFKNIYNSYSTESKNIKKLEAGDEL